MHLRTGLPREIHLDFSRMSILKRIYFPQNCFLLSLLLFCNEKLVANLVLSGRVGVCQVEMLSPWKNFEWSPKADVSTDYIYYLCHSNTTVFILVPVRNDLF